MHKERQETELVSSSSSSSFILVLSSVILSTLFPFKLSPLIMIREKMQVEKRKNMTVSESCICLTLLSIET